MAIGLLSFSTAGSESNSSTICRRSMASRAAGDTVFRIVFKPSVHLLAFVCDYHPTGRFEGLSCSG